MRNGQPLHKATSFTVARGQLIVLAGANGVGKTTLLASLMAGSSSHTGFVGRYYKRLGYAPQDATFLWRLAFDEAIWLTRASRSRYLELADSHFPFIRMPRAGTLQQLSFGQLQLVKCILALSRDADLVVLDEPFAGLDGRTATAMLGLLTDVRGSAGLLIVDHERHITAPDSTHQLEAS